MLAGRRECPPELFSTADHTEKTFFPSYLESECKKRRIYGSQR